MKKFHHWSDNIVRSGRLSGDHLSDEFLIRLLDGELSPRETSNGEAHLLSCWSCRSRRQAIDEGINALVEYQNAVAAPYLPPPLAGRATFLLRLHEVAAETRQPLQLMQFWSKALRFPGMHRISRVAQIAGVLAFAALGLIAYFTSTTEAVSANELLNRTVASDARLLRVATEPVVVQKLRINVGRHSLTRTIYHDISHNRVVSRTDSNRAAEESAKTAYLKSSLNWNSPLNAETYRHWRGGHPENREKLVRLAGNQVTLQTTFSSGPVVEADLTVRVTDYHAIAESFRFEDQSEIEIAELSYDVVPFSSLPKNIFGLPAMLAEPHLPIAAVLRPELPSNAELAAAEVKAEAVLHELGGDLGEQIDIKTHPGHEVSIEGIVADDARRQQMVSALQGISHTRLQVLTIEEAAHQSNTASSGNSGQHPSSPVQLMAAAPALLESVLQARFPDKDQRIAYVNQSLSLAQLASARAWALTRLAERHPSQSVELLDASARRQLQALLTDHVSVLREDLSSLQNQLAEILSRSSNTPAANTSSPTLDANEGMESQRDWREQVRRVHSSTEAIHEAVATLLTSSPPGSHTDVEAIEVNLRTSLTQLQAELQVLDQEVRKENLR